MRPQVVTQTGTGNSTPVIVNWRQADFKIGLATEVTGTATYTIQHTLDDPADFATAAAYNSGANWFDHNDSDLVDATTDQDGNYMFPIRAIRIELTAGTGSVELTILQGD